jgi:hypothetical protein
MGGSLKKHKLLSAVIALSLLFGGLAMGGMVASTAMASGSNGDSLGDSQRAIGGNAMTGCPAMTGGSGCCHQNAADCMSCIQVTQNTQDRFRLSREEPAGNLPTPRIVPPPDRWLRIDPAPPKPTSTV